MQAAAPHAVACHPSMSPRPHGKQINGAHWAGAASLAAKGIKVETYMYAYVCVHICIFVRVAKQRLHATAACRLTIARTHLLTAATYMCTCEFAGGNSQLAEGQHTEHTHTEMQGGGHHDTGASMPSATTCCYRGALH